MKYKKAYLNLSAIRLWLIIPVLIAVCALITGCTFSFKTNPEISREAFQENPPVKLAVLPFVNETSSEDAPELARTFFYNALAGQNYEDIEMSKVDEVISSLAVETGTNPLEINPDVLAQKLGADGLFYGTVEQASTFYMVFYAHYSVRLNLRLYDASRKKYIFKDDITARNRNFAPPSSPLGIVTSLLQNIWHLRKSEKVETYERLSRRAVENIPSPASLEGNKIRFIREIDVMIPSRNLTAGDVINVTIKGESGARAFFDIGKLKTNIAAEETEPGIYHGKYTIAENDNLKYGVVQGRLIKNNRTDEKINSSEYFEIDTNPPQTPSILSISSNQKEFILHVTPPVNDDFRNFHLYVSTDPEKGYKQRDVSERPFFRLKRLNSGEKYHFRVTAQDDLGNAGSMSEDFTFTVPPAGPVKIVNDMKYSDSLYAYSSPYIIESPIILKPNAVLNIEPGVEIRFGPRGALIAEGVISAYGKKRAPVILHGDQGWPGLRIRSSGQLRRSTLSHVRIENTSRGIMLDKGRLEAQNIEVLDCSIGISARENSFLRVTDSVFEKNHVGVFSNASNTIIKNCDFIRNTIMTEINGIVKKQEKRKIRDYTVFKY